MSGQLQLNFISTAKFTSVLRVLSLRHWVFFISEDNDVFWAFYLQRQCWLSPITVDHSRSLALQIYQSVLFVSGGCFRCLVLLIFSDNHPLQMFQISSGTYPGVFSPHLKQAPQILGVFYLQWQWSSSDVSILFRWYWPLDPLLTHALSPHELFSWLGCSHDRVCRQDLYKFLNPVYLPFPQDVPYIRHHGFE